MILDARAARENKFPAELYDPDKMPSGSLTAHKTLDKAVEKAYGIDFSGDEEKIVVRLVKLYADFSQSCLSSFCFIRAELLS